MNKLGNIVLPLDEVLVNTAPYVYSRIREHWDKYSQVFKDVGELSEDKISKRTEKSIDLWLIKDQIKEDFENDTELRAHIAQSLMVDIYFDDMYQELVPTDFGRKTLMGGFIENNEVGNIYIIDNYVSDIDKENKENFVSKYFDNSKIKLVLLPLHINKVDYIKANINWSLMVEDDLSIIQQFVFDEDELCINKEFMVPERGYNYNIDSDLLIVSAIAQNSIVHYGDTKSSNIK